MDEHTELLQVVQQCPTSHSTPALPTGREPQTLILDISETHCKKRPFLENHSIFLKETGEKPSLTETAGETPNP